MATLRRRALTRATPAWLLLLTLLSAWGSGCATLRAVTTGRRRLLHRSKIDPDAAQETVAALKKEIASEQEKSRLFAENADAESTLTKTTDDTADVFAEAEKARGEFSRVMATAGGSVVAGGAGGAGSGGLTAKAEAEYDVARKGLHVVYEERDKALAALEKESGLVKTAVDASLAEVEAKAAAAVGKWTANWANGVAAPDPLALKKKIAAAVQPYHLAILHSQRLSDAKRRLGAENLEKVKKMEAEAQWYANYAIQLQNQGLTRKGFEAMAYARAVMRQAANLQKRSARLVAEGDEIESNIAGIQANESDMAGYVKTMFEAGSV